LKSELLIEGYAERNTSERLSRKGLGGNNLAAYLQNTNYKREIAEKTCRGRLYFRAVSGRITIGKRATIEKE